MLVLKNGSSNEKRQAIRFRVLALTEGILVSHLAQYSGGDSHGSSGHLVVHARYYVFCGTK